MIKALEKLVGDLMADTPKAEKKMKKKPKPKAEVTLTIVKMGKPKKKSKDSLGPYFESGDLYE